MPDRTLVQPLIAVFLFLASTGPVAAQDPVAATKSGRSEAEVQEGRRIFNSACTLCHGVDGTVGERGPAMGPALGERRPYLRRTDEEIFDAIQKGIPLTQMPPTGLKDDEASKIVAFIQSLRAMAANVPVKGDQAAGADVFWGKGGCNQCHTIRGRGGILGPDLTNLGASRSLQDIRDALTVPKPKPPRGYRPVTVVTKDGRAISGISKNEHNFSLQMLGDDNRIHLFSMDEISRVEYADKSLMPADYGQRLRKAEFQDLLAFLSRLTRSE